MRVKRLFLLFALIFGFTFLISCGKAPSEEKKQLQVEVNGGVWLTKSDGSSDILRGQTIYFVSNDISADALKSIGAVANLMYFSDVYSDLGLASYGDNERKERRERVMISIQEQKNVLSRLYGSVEYKDDPVDVGKLVFDRLQESSNYTLKNPRFSSEKLPLNSLPLTIKTIYDNVKTRKKPFNYACSQLVSLVGSEKSATTDIDGKYSVKVDSKVRYAITFYETKTRSVIWIVPVVKSGDLAARLDLYNENALIIANYTR